MAKDAENDGETLAREGYTRFERARIVGARALQIAMGAPVILGDLPEDLNDPVTMAEMEFEEGLVPITVARPDEDRGRA